MSRFIITADWDNNAPHLTEKARVELWDSIPTYQKDARTKGIPQLGAGVIYPVSEDDLLVDPFQIPDHWPRGYGLDIGWNRVAAIWRTCDPDTNPRIHYIYDEHYMGEQSPTIHAAAIKERGLWIPGRIDPAARGRSQEDGKRLITVWRKAIYGKEDLSLGVQMLGVANNAVESGIYELLMAQQHGVMKVFRHRCPNLLAERRLYRRDEKGRIIKKRDHAMDAWRYNVFSGDSWLVAKPKPPVVSDPMARFTRGDRSGNLDWMST